MPAHAVPIKTKWVVKLKRNEKNQVTRYKARLTACGYAQCHGRDYDETFSPAASAASIRFLFCMAACMNLFLEQHDVQTAFLYGVLPKGQPVYLRPPLGVDLPDDWVFVYLRSIYGLKQSPRLFNEHLSRAIAKLGYVQSKPDPCVWFKHSGADFAIVAIVADDMLHTASSRRLLYVIHLQNDSPGCPKIHDRDQDRHFIILHLSQPGTLHPTARSAIRTYSMRTRSHPRQPFRLSLLLLTPNHWTLPRNPICLSSEAYCGSVSLDRMFKLP